MKNDLNHTGGKKHWLTCYSVFEQASLRACVNSRLPITAMQPILMLMTEWKITLANSRVAPNT